MCFSFVLRAAVAGLRPSSANILLNILFGSCLGLLREWLDLKSHHMLNEYTEIIESNLNTILKDSIYLILLMKHFKHGGST